MEKVNIDGNYLWKTVFSTILHLNLEIISFLIKKFHYNLDNGYSEIIIFLPIIDILILLRNRNLCEKKTLFLIFRYRFKKKSDLGNY